MLISRSSRSRPPCASSMSRFRPSSPLTE
jgi:hypothetical protein